MRLLTQTRNKTAELQKMLYLKFYTLLLDFTLLEEVFFTYLSVFFLNSTFVFDIPRWSFSTRFVKITQSNHSIFDSTL